MGDDGEQRVPPGEYTLSTEQGSRKSSIGFSGNGTAAYANGDIYEGQFQKGVREGSGVYKYLNGDVFTGTFENNLKTGLGRVTYNKGGSFHGYFKDGKREGEGTLKYANGDIYSGPWLGGKRHGKGMYVYAKTKYAITGEWKDGQIAQGEWTFTDGTKYVGGFSSQKPCGDGVWQTARGTIVEGAYMQQVVPIDSAPPVGPGEIPTTATRTFWKTTAMVAVED